MATGKYNGICHGLAMSCHIYYNTASYGPS